MSQFVAELLSFTLFAVVMGTWMVSGASDA